MKLTKLTPLFLALALGLFAVGCSSAPKGKQMSPVAAKESNFLGIITVKPQSFTVESPNGATIQTSDIVSRRDFSGTQTSVLWGLITVADY